MVLLDHTKPFFWTVSNITSFPFWLINMLTGLLPSPCFYNFLARTTFVLESLPKAQNPGQDAFFLEILSSTTVQGDPFLFRIYVDILMSQFGLVKTIWLFRTMPKQYQFSTIQGMSTDITLQTPANTSDTPKHHSYTPITPTPPPPPT